MSQLAISIIVGILDILFCVLCILLFIYSHKLGKLSAINKKLETANRLCEDSKHRIYILDRKIYKQEQILRHKKEVEELAKAISIEINKNRKHQHEDKGE